MDETINKILEQFSKFREQVGTSFLATTLLSWACINYKIVLWAVGNAETQVKVDQISAYLQSASIYRELGAWPLFAGTFWTLGYPLIDIAFTAASQLLVNFKTSVIYFIQKRRAVDRHAHLMIIEALRAQLDQSAKEISDILARVDKDTVESNATQTDLSNRLVRETILRYSNGKNVNAVEINQTLTEMTNPDLDPEAIKKFIRGLPLVSELLVLCRHMRDADMDSRNRIVMKFNVIQSLMNDANSSFDAIDVADLAVALGLMRSLPNKPREFLSTLNETSVIHGFEKLIAN